MGDIAIYRDPEPTVMAEACLQVPARPTAGALGMRDQGPQTALPAQHQGSPRVRSSQGSKSKQPATPTHGPAHTAATHCTLPFLPVCRDPGQL